MNENGMDFNESAVVREQYVQDVIGVNVLREFGGLQWSIWPHVRGQLNLPAL
jgi:hypothetical protein